MSLRHIADSKAHFHGSYTTVDQQDSLDEPVDPFDYHNVRAAVGFNSQLVPSEPHTTMGYQVGRDHGIFLRPSSSPRPATGTPDPPSIPPLSRWAEFDYTIDDHFTVEHNGLPGTQFQLTILDGDSILEKIPDEHLLSKDTDRVWTSLGTEPYRTCFQDPFDPQAPYWNLPNSCNSLPSHELSLALSTIGSPSPEVTAGQNEIQQYNQVQRPISTGRVTPMNEDTLTRDLHTSSICWPTHRGATVEPMIEAWSSPTPCDSEWQLNSGAIGDLATPAPVWPYPLPMEPGGVHYHPYYEVTPYSCQKPFQYTESTNSDRTSSLGQQDTTAEAGPSIIDVPTRTPVQRSIARRKAEDAILLEGKREGLTYREIKKRIGANIAESTLRGRFRSLTKAREARVRKPVWTRNDMRLLEKGVLLELSNDDERRYRSYPSRGMKLAKVSWKKVADYIVKNGGSYHFGNSTCKKKWMELTQA